MIMLEFHGALRSSLSFTAEALPKNFKASRTVTV